jgi:hypothetical protein
MQRKAALARMRLLPLNEKADRFARGQRRYEIAWSQPIRTLGELRRVPTLTRRVRIPMQPRFVRKHPTRVHIPDQPHRGIRRYDSISRRRVCACGKGQQGTQRRRI